MTGWQCKTPCNDLPAPPKQKQAPGRHEHGRRSPEVQRRLSTLRVIEQRTKPPPASELLILGEPNRFVYWSAKKKPAVVQRGTPAARPSRHGYLQLRADRGCHGQSMHRTFSWTLPTGILRVQCIHNGSDVAFLSPHFTLCRIHFSVSNILVLWPVHLRFSVVISQKLDEDQQANNDNKVPPYHKNTL